MTRNNEVDSVLRTTVEGREITMSEMGRDMFRKMSPEDQKSFLAEVLANKEYTLAQLVVMYDIKNVDELLPQNILRTKDAESTARLKEMSKQTYVYTDDALMYPGTTPEEKDEVYRIIQQVCETAEREQKSYVQINFSNEVTCVFEYSYDERKHEYIPKVVQAEGVVHDFDGVHPKRLLK